jgi:hypothetical protein
MKLPKNFIKMLENKYVLYFVLFLAVTNILGYLVFGNINAVIFFILVSFLVTNFSKNMIIILTIPLILTSILMVGKRVKEGLENKDELDVEPSSTRERPEKNLTPEQKKKLYKIKQNIKQKIDKVIDEAKPMIGTSDGENIESDTMDDSMDENNEYETTTKEIDGFQSDGTNKKRNRIDYAATVEDAYGDLNKVLGGDGIKRLTEDTQKLMSQQMQLADAMKNMGPLLEQAKGMLKGFDFKELGGIANIAKSFGGFGGQA